MIVSVVRFVRSLGVGRCLEWSAMDVRGQAGCIGFSGIIGCWK